MPEEERERSTRFTIQASPSWSEVPLIRHVLSENIGEVRIFIPYLRADYNSPSLVGERNLEGDGERIQEELGSVLETRLLLNEVAVVDPSKLSREDWRYVMDRTQAPFHICETQLVVLLEATGLKKLKFGYCENKLGWGEYYGKLIQHCDLATP